jgi:hypothetical protein
MLRRISLLLLAYFPLALSGCGNVITSDGPSNSDYRIGNQVQPVEVKNLIQKPSQDPSALTPQTDPLTQGADPMTGGATISGGAPASGDPLIDGASTGGASTHRPIQNWYWLRGNVANGSVEVKVNGIPIGRFSVQVDTEISNYLDYGTNSITFTTRPSTNSVPVAADLIVVYSQQPDGALPILTYDTTQESSSSLTKPTPSGADSIKPGVQGLAAPLLAPTVSSDASTTQTLTFRAS